MYNRNMVTNVSVEVNPSGVCGKSLHLPKLTHYLWLFSFQVVHLHAPSLPSVLTCSLTLSLPQWLLLNVFKRKYFSGTQSAAFWGCPSLPALRSPLFALHVSLAGGRWRWGFWAAREQMTCSGCAVCSSTLHRSQTEFLRINSPVAFWGLV